MAKDDWFRLPTLTSEARDLFEQRLQRSHSSRPEYMRVQAEALQEAGAHRQSIKMIERIMREYPDHWATAWLYESRAECHRQLRHFDQAILDYTTSIDTMKDRPGVRGHATTRLASLAYELGRSDLYEPCLGHLGDFWDPDPLFPRDELHQFGWTAVLLHALGKLADAKPPARRALAAAAKTRSNAANHRSLGLASPADRPLVKRLRQIVRDRPFERAITDARALVDRLRERLAREC